MKRLSLLILSFGLSAAVLVGQTPDRAVQEREALCRKVACREATTIKLKVDDKRYAEFSFPRSPFVAEGFINILIGERFGVEFDEKDGRLTAPHYVKEIAHADRTVSFELSQLENHHTMLTVVNPFQQAIVYHCMIQHYEQTRFSETTVLPVEAKLKTFESWPYPIAQVVISNLRFQSQQGGGIRPGGGIDSPIGQSIPRFVTPAKLELQGAAKSATEIVITLSTVFRSNGTVTDIRVVGVRPEHVASKDVIDGFKNEAIKAAKTIKFEPAIKDGRAVSQYIQLAHTFKLSDDDKKTRALER